MKEFDLGISDEDRFALAGVNPRSVYEKDPFGEIPVLEIEELPSAAVKKYNELAQATTNTENPFVLPQEAAIVEGDSSYLLLYSNEKRINNYLDRNRRSNGLAPNRGTLNFYNLPIEETIGRIRGTSFKALINSNPVSKDNILLVPSLTRIDNNVKHLLYPSLNGEERLAERGQDPSFFNKLDYIQLGEISQKGDLLVWYNGTSPSQNSEHAHAKRAVQSGIRVPIVNAVEKGNYDRNIVHFGRTRFGDPLNLSCITTNDPQEAHYLNNELNKNDYPADLIITPGKKDPVFVLIPTPINKSLKVTLFPDLIDDVNRWDWMPSAENAGFILRHPLIQLPSTRADSLKIGDKEICADDFNSHIYNAIHSMHPTPAELKGFLSHV